MNARKLVVLLVLAALAVPSLWAQSKPAANGDWQAVLNAMDRASASFRSAQADFNWDQYTKVVDSHDYQKGTIYFRRQGRNLEMAADVKDPGQKYVLYQNDKVQVYEPHMEQVTQYSTGKNKADFESFLAIGFGGSGHDLQKAFDVSYGGRETIDGVATEKLELVPKAAKARNLFSHITLWIDPARGVSLQQKFDEGSGDYRLAKYSNIKINPKLSNDLFKLHTTGKTTYVSPQG